ncbi:MAG: amino acid adenylation domain-containing protein [Paucimonas sp.]|jgi:amino acid adenylation domain-containing protein/non-ribosomal peptide synthase protein (TIGR01720 family)|nr:amino acid adenylation domain-containing protein [Paucimonas sp.]
MDNQATAARIARRFVLMPLEKRRLYLEKMAAENLSPANLPVPECQSALEVLPLSHAQERLWFIWQLEPDSAAYNLSRALRLHGELDLGALGQAFAALVARHQPLRTLFGLHEGRACQLIQAPFAVEIAVQEVAADALQACIEDEAHQPFDLSAGPLLRVRLLRLAADEHVLVLTLHHIVADGWSMQLLVDELVQGYLAQVAPGQGRAAAALPIQYADYAIWQRAWMEAGEQARQLAYWVEELGDEQPALQLPADHLRPAAPSGRGDSVELELPEVLGAALHGVAQAHGATVFMLLLASFQALLHRYSGQQDIRVGVPSANRNRPEIEGLVGFFVNTQVMRAQVDGRMPFATLLQQVKARAIRAQAYQDLPFEQVVERLSPERSLSHSPLFQVMFNHLRESAGQGLVALPGLRVEGVQWRNHTAKLDLALDTREAPDGRLSARFTYACDLFERATVERLACHWLQLLQAIAADSDCALGELALLDAQERAAALRAWQRPAEAMPFTPVHQRIAAQARLRPQAIAVTCEGRSLSFAELDGRAERLAASLWQRTGGRGVRIGIALPRDEQVFVALLAVLKAGCAYVPLDLKHPPQRLAYLMRDAGMPLLLTHASVSAGLPEDSQVQALDIDALLAESVAPLPPQAIHPAQLAYVIYTSGSTGEPKGVEVGHEGIARHCQAIGERYAMSADDCELLFMSLAFDGAHERWLTTLSHGGRLLLREDSLWTPEQTLQAMLAHGVSVAAFPPVYLQQLTEQAALGGPLPRARIYCFGGDAVPRASFERLREVLRPDHIINGYGPTETVVTPLLWKAPADQPCPSAYAPIGSPVGPRTACVLDAEANLMPAGASGELYLGGLLAQGYLNRPGLTAERFVPDPFAAGGERLYRTGDLVRQRADGDYDYMGRVDQQVKIRGFRIELGEIESRLLALEGVDDAVVQAREGQGGKQLVAYVVAAAGQDGQALVAQLRTRLRADLPDYMVPAHFMLLASLPLNPNGKVDRKALPAPSLDSRLVDHVEPAAGLEAQIAALWQDILGHAAVSATANFFELGGDSIIAIQVVGRARQAGIRFTPKDMFLHQSVRELAQVARRAEAEALAEQGPEQGATALLPIAEWFFAQAHPRPAHWNQALVLEPRQPLSSTRLREALQCLLAHHDSLRLRFTPTGQDVQACYRDAVDAGEVLWHEQLSDEAHWPALADKAQRSLDLAEGPLLRVVLADLPGQRQALLLVIHHLVVDGVSWRILLDDLQGVLSSLEQGQPVRLPSRTSSVKAWAGRLLEAAAQPRWQAQLDYWQALADGPLAELPARAGAEVVACNAQARQLEVTLDEATTARLLHQAPAAYRTQINDLLLAALALAVRGWTGQARTLVQLEGHGRESETFEGIDLTRSVGWFTSAYPVCLGVADDLAATLMQVKEQLRAVPDKGLGFGLLRHLGDAPTRARMAALPEARITFNYLGQVDGGFGEDAQGWFRPGTLGAGSSQDDQAPLGNWLTINGRIEGGRLTLAWKFAEQQFAAADIAALADGYLQHLRALVEHCCDPANGALTPSDFPLLALSQAQLAQLPVAARQVQDLYPLSPMQQGMLFHSLYQQGSADYINQLRCDVEGLDPERFLQAWQQAMDRHDILRSAFLWGGAFDQPVQLVQRQLAFPLRVLDWRDRPVEAAALDALAEAERQAGFALASAPLLRMLLVRLDEHRHHLIYTNHHVLMDGWSSSQLLGEVLQAYAGQTVAAVRGRYRDYIAWLQRQDVAASQRFWQAQLAPLEAPTLLANAFASRAPEPATDTLRQQAARLIDGQACARLNQFARRCKVTLNTVVQGAWGLLLQRWSGQDVVAFGATVAGRPAELAGIEQQVGLFINTLPVVVQADPGQALEAWLQALQAQNLALREHEHCALADVQRCAGFEPQALLDSLLVFENYPVAEALGAGAPAGVRFATIDSREQTHLPFTLTVHQGDGLALGLTCVGLDDPGLGERLLEQLAEALEQMSQAASGTLGELALLGAAEQHQVVRQWNATARHYPQAQSVHRLFEAQVRARPEALALVCAGQRLDNTTLNAQANRLAHQLIALGVGPESRVAVVAERSVEMVVALLAVLKAGGAYVPVDPELPAERIAYLLQDSAAQLLLGQAALRERVPVDAARTCLWLEPGALIGEGYPAHDPQPALQPENLAYLIYTSGSTGQPKGAGNSHAALCNRLAWMQEAYALGEGDRVLQKTPFSFDVSVWEFFWPLMTGVPLVMALPGEHRDPAQLIARIVAERITTMHFVPSMLQAFLQDPQVARCSSLRRIVCSGEALPVEAQRQVFERLPGVALYNLYGPTEAAIDVTHWTCREEGGDTVPIGQPIANLATYVLDAALRPLPAGVVGELYLGGLGLARGYHQRPALTAERFVASPFGAGQRLYRTGDLARQRGDGVIEYAGRIDHQVKIRGQRIELGEIEARLMEQPWVNEAVVVARDGSHGKRLVAYLVAAAEAPMALGEVLAEQLRAVLPAYMVPAHFEVLASMPLSPNGKLDRKALPEPGLAQVASRAPQGAHEQALAQIWQEVLGLEQVGADDNFFALGGDSIVSIQVVNRARQRGLALEPRDLFEQQTIARLALKVGSGGALPALATPKDWHGLSEAQVQALPLPHERITGLYSLSPMQKGMLFLGLDSPDAQLYVNQLSVPVHGLDPQRLRQAWVEVVRRHDILRTGFLWQGLDEPLQFVLDALALAFSERDGRDLAGDPVAIGELAREERERGFDLANPPLQRLLLVDLGEGGHQLIWTYHHLLVDGWSTSQLMGEVLALYAGKTLPEPVAYRQYIGWLRNQDQARGEAFWRAQLEPLEEPTLLAAWQPRRADGEGHQALYTRFDAGLTGRLKAFAQQQRITFNTLVQGAWLLLLSRYSGQSCVAFGATVAGRPANLAHSDAILGLFINTLPVVHPLQPTQAVGDWLRALQARNLAMRDFEFTPLAQIQRWAGRPGQPLFDSIIVFENHPVDQALRDWSDERLRFGEMDSVGLTNLPMDLMVTLDEVLTIEYMFLRQHFDAQAVEGIRLGMEGLLQALAEDGERRLGVIGLPCPSQPQARLPAGADAHWQPVHARIAEWAAGNPQHPALVCAEGARLSHGELQGRANRLAHWLIAQGVGPEVRVAVVLPRNEHLLVALLAVLKAGGTYVPLDIDYPRERLAWQLQDCGAALVLTAAEQRERLPIPQGALAVDLPGLALDTWPEQAPVCRVDPHNLAYIIYTSGSTGLPKGVAVSHGPLAMHCLAVGELYQMSPDDCELHFMSFAFDGAHERWLTALSHGARLLLRGDELWTAQQTLAQMRQHQVTVAAFPPVYLQQLAEQAEREGQAPAVRVYCFGGDAVPKAAFERVRAALAPQWIINGYGPTETVVTPLIWRADAVTDCDSAYAPIGSIVGRRSAHVLDADLNPLPIGLAGELYLGGEGLARGYLERPGLSAERFVADPFGAPGLRLYRTGDLVRQRADGGFDYLGRLDQQVKVRGFRIELGEVEACLKRCPGVRDAVVVAHAGVSGQRLAGYVVMHEPALAVDPRAALSQALEQALPDYMRPSSLTVLEQLPLTPNGKIDRRNLPLPGAEPRRYVAPHSELQKALAAIWSEVLKVAQVGLTDNFYELGGDSILSLQVVAKARGLTRLGLRLKLRDLVSRPTIAELTGEVAQGPRLAPTLALNAASGQAPLFCLHAGFGTVFDYEPLARRLDGRRPLVGLPCRLLLEPGRQEQSLQAMAIDYAAAIRGQQAEGPYHLLGWSLGGTLAALVAAELEGQGQQVAFLGLADSFVPGTEQVDPDRPGDWHADLQGLLGWISDQAPQVDVQALACAQTARDYLGQTLALNGRQGGAYAALGLDEWLNLFDSARQLKRLALAAGPCPALRCVPTHWWVAGRKAHRLALASQLRQPLEDAVILPCDHFQLPRDAAWLDAVEQALAPCLAVLASD